MPRSSKQRLRSSQSPDLDCSNPIYGWLMTAGSRPAVRARCCPLSRIVALRAVRRPPLLRRTSTASSPSSKPSWTLHAATSARNSESARCFIIRLIYLKVPDLHTLRDAAPMTTAALPTGIAGWPVTASKCANASPSPGQISFETVRQRHYPPSRRRPSTARSAPNKQREPRGRAPRPECQSIRALPW